MKTLTIKASERKDLGKKGAAKIRKEGNVLGVIYGGAENVHFYAEEKQFKNLVYTPDVFKTTIEVGGNKYDAVMKDLQFHPVTDKILHVDFISLKEDAPVTIDLPVKLQGTSIGVRAGGKLAQRHRTLKVRGLAKHFPEAININIESLKIGDGVKVSTLSFEGVTILDAPNDYVVSVQTSRKATAEEETAAAAAAAPAAAVAGKAAPAAAAGAKAPAAAAAKAPAKK